MASAVYLSEFTLGILVLFVEELVLRSEARLPRWVLLGAAGVSVWGELGVSLLPSLPIDSEYSILALCTSVVLMEFQVLETGAVRLTITVGTGVAVVVGFVLLLGIFSGAFLPNMEPWSGNVALVLIPIDVFGGAWLTSWIWEKSTSFVEKHKAWIAAFFASTSVLVGGIGLFGIGRNESTGLVALGLLALFVYGAIPISGHYFQSQLMSHRKFAMPRGGIRKP